MMLADLYMWGLRTDKTIAIYSRMVAHDAQLLPVSCDLEVYAIMQLGRAYAKRPDELQQCIDVLTKAYAPQYAGSEWTAEAIFRLGVFTYNITQDPKQCIPHYRYVFTRYGKHPVAEHAMYFYCRNMLRAGETAGATTACKDFLAKYPASRYVMQIKNMLAKGMPTTSGMKGQRQ